MCNKINAKENSISFSSWKNINWNVTIETVNRLRGNIYKARKMGKEKLVLKLQRIMLRSKANILLSIRRVTSLNKGKLTPGLDNRVIQTYKDRWNLYLEILELSQSDWIKIAKPVKRIYIPKTNGKTRPLGIPSIKDRVIQSLVKNALEPEWEAIFESSSYGFRPGRSCHDALSRIFVSTARQKRRLWVLEADIKGCFDNIDHSFILDAIGNFPAKKIIKTWLKSGYCEFPSTEIMETLKGTPQGGIISPLLANIALHGMENALGIQTVSTTGHNYGSNKYATVRYADDFVVLAYSKEDCENAKTLLDKWLKIRGLEFAPDKVKIVHLTEGFQFLGCSIRLYGKKQIRLLIKPHKKSISSIKSKLRETWFKHTGNAPQHAIMELNPITRGWANYYKPFVSSRTFANLDHFMWHRAWRYAKRRHPNKNHHWIANKYFGSQKGPSKDRWRFFAIIGNDNKIFLLKFSDFKISRHVMVKNNMVPDNRSKIAIKYWQKRYANKQYLKWGGYESRLKIAKRQYHICPICFDTLYNDEELHVHHIKPKKEKGPDTYTNLVLVHEPCHYQIHSNNMSETDVRNQLYNLRRNMKIKFKNDLENENTNDSIFTLETGPSRMR